MVRPPGGGTRDDRDIGQHSGGDRLTSAPPPASRAGIGACEGGLAGGRLPIPAIAPRNDNAAAPPMAAVNPALKARAEPRPPIPANSAPRIAIPNAPPRKRNMLKMPDAWPISLAATELNTAFCAAGIAIETPAPATISGATSLA